jgi:pyridoxamine 5'-phosphate oxidase family protein
MFTDAEYEFLVSHGRGRLASIGPESAPQIHPAPFVVDVILGCVEIGGRNLRDSQKYRNVRRDPRVSLIIDDDASPLHGPDDTQGRGVEIRGLAEVSETPWPMSEGFGTDVIRIRPVRIDTWNIDGPGHRSRLVPE